VPGRKAAAITAKITIIQGDVDAPASGPGGRALYLGLTRTTFSTAPVIIVSSGLDLSNPDNFRSLQWSVPAAEIVAEVKSSDDLPALHGPVIFVLVPTAGGQPQLGQQQKDYIETVWTALLKAAGATSVTFVDADSAGPAASAPSAPAVPVPSQPATKIPVRRLANGKFSCTVTDSFFSFDRPSLADPRQIEQDLAPCVDGALAAHATFALDGWASYEGPLNAAGQPPVNEPYNIKLSVQRVGTIARLLVDYFKVPKSDITHMVGHGNLDQPNPDPRSAANRVLVITYTVK
jgi:hypothetical protein